MSSGRTAGVSLPNNHSKYRTSGGRVRSGRLASVRLRRASRLGQADHCGAGVERPRPLAGQPLDFDAGRGEELRTARRGGAEARPARSTSHSEASSCSAAPDCAGPPRQPRSRQSRPAGLRRAADRRRPARTARRHGESRGTRPRSPLPSAPRPNKKSSDAVRTQRSKRPGSPALRTPRSIARATSLWLANRILPLLAYLMSAAEPSARRRSAWHGPGHQSWLPRPSGPAAGPGWIARSSTVSGSSLAPVGPVSISRAHRRADPALEARRPPAVVHLGRARPGRSPPASPARASPGPARRPGDPRAGSRRSRAPAWCTSPGPRRRRPARAPRSAPTGRRRSTRSSRRTGRRPPRRP